ncbi:MAG: phosphoserine phosphatase SerB, partial [Betaproteobacteria bacterium]|nr:phosphoserine phosphatase SerB [Betaproteobacteria bacterium]
VGKKAEIAAITEAAMRGEIADYADSLRRRVALLAGVPLAALDEIYTQRLRLNPGAEALLAAARERGLKTLLVSGGFTFFTDRLQARLGLDYTRSNTLDVHDGHLTGRLVGPIVDGVEKRAMLERTCAALGVGTAAAIAIGDGSNDLPMMRVAGLSVAYHAKPAVQAEAMLAINNGGLDALLQHLH